MVTVEAKFNGTTITQRCSDHDIAERVAREFVQRGFTDVEIDGVPFEQGGLIDDRERS